MSEQDIITYSTAARWRRVRANKMNQRTANRIQQIGETASPKHKRVLRDALRDWASQVGLSKEFPEFKTAELLTTEAVYHLAFCQHTHSDAYPRTVAVVVARAIVGGKTVEQCRQLYKSKRDYYRELVSDHAASRRAVWTALDANTIVRREEKKPAAEGETITHVMTHDLPRDEIYEGDTVTILANGKCQSGAVGMVRIKRSYFGGHPSDFGKVKVDRIYQADPEHVRIGESYHDIEKIEDVRIIGQVIHVEHKPLPPDTDGILDAETLYESDDDVLSEDIITLPNPLPPAPQGRRRKGTKRIPVTVKRFEGYGILRGDTAIIVMNGDIQVGELGYFSTEAYGHWYDQLAFVCEQDATCYDGYGHKRTPESLCLRHEYNNKKCQCVHEAKVYGRVCAVERKGQPVEHKLKLRPFDERLDALT